MDKKKVIIVEDMDLARSGMRMAIGFYMPDFCVAGEAFFPLLDSVGADTNADKNAILQSHFFA